MRQDRKLALVVLAAVLAMPCCGHAQLPQDYSKLDMATLQQKANAGDLGAEQQLGLDYANGLGVPKDYAQAATWYRKAADRGAAYSQNELGYLYQKGLGVAQDYGRAV